MTHDWITTYLAATEGIPSPPRFRLWAGISAIAGALEGRVYTQTYADKTMPNLYIALAGLPGSGKTQSISITRNLWAKIGTIRLAPSDVTSASFYDAIFDSTKTMMNGKGVPEIVAPITAVIREFGTFVPKYDIGFLSILSDLFDNPEYYYVKRRTTKSVELNKPTVNILAGVTPGYLSDLLPETAWNQGFTSRFIFVYDFADPDEKIDIFKLPQRAHYLELLDQLKIISEIVGEMTWTDEAMEFLNSWRNTGSKPLPGHFRLKEYCSRRVVHALKLSMIAAISRGAYEGGIPGMVEVQDVQKAHEWLFDAEDFMPDVFRAMTAKSDMQLINELHYWMFQTWAKLPAAERKGLPESDIFSFLAERVESHRIRGVLETAEKIGKVKRGNMPDEWIPVPDV